MAGGLSTFDEIWRGVRLRCPAAPATLARQWTNFAFRQLWDYKLWSWQRKQNQFILDQVYNTGLVTVTRGSQIVTGVGTGWTSNQVNHQFRIGLQTPIYTILSVQSATQLTLTQVFGAPSTASVGYQIYNAYVTPPSDFQNFIVIIDPRFNWALALNVTQEELDIWDAQRSNLGNTSYVCASRDFDDVFNSPPLPRYELWPHQTSQVVYPFHYVSRPPDLSDPGATLPRMIRGDVLLEGVMSQCARWPGPSKDQVNPYYNLALATQHEVNYERMLTQLARTDDEVMENDVTYVSLSSMNIPAMAWGDSRWLQSHEGPY